MAAWWIWRWWGVFGLLAGIILLAPLACWASHVILSRAPADKDPGWIVVDEWLGQWLCLLIMGAVADLSAYWFIAAFVAFRILDIAKPWPISKFEHMGPAWWAIQADDLAAGAIAGTMLALLAVLW